MQRVNVCIGRFQPFTAGHYKCVEAAWKQKGLPTVICIINVSPEKVDQRHPFPSNMLADLYGDLFSNDNKIAGVIPVKSANIVMIGQVLRDNGFEIASWTCGTDRFADYTKMSSRYHEQAGLTDDFEMIEVPRSDEDISATKARNCLLNDDRAGFLSMIPAGSNEDELYSTLKEQIDSVYGKNESCNKLSSSMINENLQDMNLWHVSKSKITSLGSTPMFFALEKSHSTGWYRSALNDGADSAYMYKATLKPNAVIITYQELKQMLSLPNDNGYIEMLVSNPSSSEILSNNITKAAIKNGIDGITYLDYDPKDFGKDLEAVILFNPRKSLSSIEEEPIKSSNRKASNEPNSSIVSILKKVADIFKKKYKDIDVNYDSGYMGKQAFRMYVDNFINGGELQVAYQYKNNILSVFIPGVLGTKETEIDIESMSPIDIVNIINTMTGANESLLRRVVRLERLVRRFRHK